MEIQPVPQHVRDGRPWAEVKTVGKPPGMTDGECGSAEMQSSFEELSPGRRYPHWYAHFRPRPEELEALNAGGTVELCLLGDAPQPFSLNVWPAADGSTGPT